MSARPDASELRSLLRTAFLGRLEPAGWELLETENDHQRLAAFRYPLHDEFAATGEVSLALSFPDRPPVLVTSVLVGVSYEPLRRLSPLLGSYEVSVLVEHVWPEISDADDEDEEDHEDEGGEEPLEVRTADDADRAADALAPLIAERALPFAERHATLEDLLADFSSDDDEDWSHPTYVSLLAAARRFDEAEQALARLEVPERSALERDSRRARRQLQRWVDSRGDSLLIPSSPPPSRFRTRKVTSLSELVSQTWAESQAQRAALNEVKESARGRSREEARTMLREALARHGARKQSPFWVESRLDHLWDSPEDRVQLGIKVLKGAARFGFGVAKAIRERELPDLSPPDWLEPPDHALYEVPRSNSWIAAELDPEARPWLDRVYDATPHPFGIATLSAWVSRRGAGAGAVETLDVHLGERRVGNVPAEEVGAYADVIADAAARDEDLCLDAHLAHRGGEYLLELAKPDVM